MKILQKGKRNRTASTLASCALLLLIALPVETSARAVNTIKPRAVLKRIVAKAFAQETTTQDTITDSAAPNNATQGQTLTPPASTAPQGLQMPDMEMPDQTTTEIPQQQTPPAPAPTPQPMTPPPAATTKPQTQTQPQPAKPAAKPVALNVSIPSQSRRVLEQVTSDLPQLPSQPVISAVSQYGSFSDYYRWDRLEPKTTRVLLSGALVLALTGLLLLSGWPSYFLKPREQDRIGNGRLSSDALA